MQRQVLLWFGAVPWSRSIGMKLVAGCCFDLYLRPKGAVAAARFSGACNNRLREKWEVLDISSDLSGKEWNGP